MCLLFRGHVTQLQYVYIHAYFGIGWVWVSRLNTHKVLYECWNYDVISTIGSCKLIDATRPQHIQSCIKYSHCSELRHSV